MVLLLSEKSEDNNRKTIIAEHESKIKKKDQSGNKGGSKDGSRAGTSSSRNRSQRDLKTLEEAKRAVMTRFHMTEPEAHKYLQKRAMDAGIDLIEASEKFLLLYGRD